MKILLADDHKMMRDGLKAILEQSGLQVVGEAASGREAVEMALALRPDVVIMDIAMPELNGIDATQRMVAELPGIKVIGLSMTTDRRYVGAMFKAGAVGYLPKNSASEELIQAVRAVADNLTYISPSVAGLLVENFVDGAPCDTMPDTTLTPRGREVLQLLAEGKSSKEIAACLNVAVATVETHRRQIMDKLNLRTIAELTKFAIRAGLTSVE